MADTVKDLMTSDCTCVSEGETIQDVARKLGELNVGAVPICGDDDKLHGMITDRDIALKVVAEGKDPSSVTAADLAQGKPVTISADSSCDEAMTAMAENQVRRLPVIGDDKRLVGIVSQADLARREDASAVGSMVGSISK